MTQLTALDPSACRQRRPRLYRPGVPLGGYQTTLGLLALRRRRERDGEMPALLGHRIERAARVLVFGQLRSRWGWRVAMHARLVDRVLDRVIARVEAEHGG